MNIFRTLLLSSLFLSGIAPSIADDLVSFDLVRQSSGSLEARMPYEVSTAIREQDRLELVSADGYDLGLSVSKTTYSPLGNRIIHASTDGGGKAIIVVDDAGGLLGSIIEFGERHRIYTAADGQRRILREGYSGQEKRIDNGGIAPEVESPTSQIIFDVKEEELSSSPSRIMKAERSSDVIYPTYKTGTARISVLMYYDDSMSNVFSTIDFITQLANDAFADSGAKIKIDIVGTKALDIDDEASHMDLILAMDEGEAPFEEIESDRSFFEADLVFILRDTAADDEDFCGLGSSGVYQQNHYRSQFTGLVQWKPADGMGGYCPETTFAHEVGHILGSAHDRADRTEDGEKWLGAYTYSYGTALEGVFRTVMGVSNTSSSPRLALFSSPDLNCNGYPCGKPASNPDSADNVSTFQSTGHLIASNEGPFAFEAVSTFATRGSELACTTSDETDGFFRGVYIANQSAFSVEVQSTHYGRPDGTYRVFEYEADAYTLGPSGVRGRGYCREEGEDPVMGTQYDKAFLRYLHPETGQIVQTATHEWDDSYEGEYTTVRVASGQGGSVSGNTIQSVRVGSSQTFTFTPVGGYEVANIQSNCSGSKSGNSYTVDVGQDNCFVEAAFSQVAVSETLRVSIETPANGQVYSGIGNFQGWAVAQEGIERVDLYVDDVFFQSAPYGGSRGDVGSVFPDVPNSSESGFSLAYNYGNLEEGTHKLKAIAVTEDGRTLDRTTTFSVAKFHKSFIGPQDVVSVDGAFCSVQDDEITVIDALIDGKSYDISLEWRTGTQGFEIYEIR